MTDKNFGLLKKIL